MTRFPLLLLSLATLAACGGDTKEESSSSSGGGGGEEPTADNDGDGLTNGEEADMGTDPDAADSDGDGTSDPDEIAAGTNPKFIWSHPYAEGDYLVGACPVLPDEAASGPTGQGSLSGNTWDAYQEGDVMHNLAVGGSDSFGQEVPVYSFCGNYTMVVQSAEWCGPCQQLASMIPDELETIRAAVPNFTFYEVIYQNNRGSNPNQRTLANWRDSFALDGVPVVAPADNTAADMNWINASGGIPATLLLAPDMTVIWSGIDHPGEYYLTDARDVLRAIRQYENGN